MGSLTSGPSVPSASSPQIVFVPQAVTTTPVTSSAATTTATATTTTTASNNASSNTDISANEVAEQSLLSRDRSRFGTIATSFRGLLGLGEQTQAAPRKTLLGE